MNIKEIFKRKNKRCPRCNLKTPIDTKVCTRCELNFDKFENVATNKEAKIAFKNKEKERVLFSNHIPKDVSFIKLLLHCIFLGLFGGHYFYVGRKKMGLFILISAIIFFATGIPCILYEINSGLLYILYQIVSYPYAVAFVIVLFDIVEIIFRRFKIPVSIAYKEEN